MGDGLILFSSVVIGAAAALLWNAEGRLILEYAALAEDDLLRSSLCGVDGEIFTDGCYGSVDDDFRRGVGGGGSNERTSGSLKTGGLLGLFWASFMGSSLLGGTIAFFSYRSSSQSDSSDSSGSVVSMYTIFLAICLSGSFLTVFLRSPSSLQRYRDHDGTARENHVAAELPNDAERLLREETTNSASSWWNESKMTVSLFASKRIALHLATLFFYVGFAQPYQISTFGNRFFDEKTLGLELMVFYTSDMIGALLVGYLLDRTSSSICHFRADDRGDNMITTTVVEKETLSGGECEIDQFLLGDDGTSLIDDAGESTEGGRSLVDNSNQEQNQSSSSHRRNIINSLTLCVITTLIGNTIGLSMEATYIDFTENDTKISLDYTDIQKLIAPTIAFSCWGFSDGLLQTYSYWLIGFLFKEKGPREQSRVIGYYRCLQSLGWAVGCTILPTSRLNPVYQLVLSTFVFVVGVLLSLLELPRVSLSHTNEGS